MPQKSYQATEEREGWEVPVRQGLLHWKEGCSCQRSREKGHWERSCGVENVQGSSHMNAGGNVAPCD